MLTEEDLEDLGGYDQPFLDRPAHSSSSADLPSVGQVYEGVVVKTQPFGAFVEIPGFKQHGLVHISQLSEMKVDEVEDVVSKGQRVFVKVLEIKRVDGKERISLSMKYCSQSDGRDKDVNGVNAELEMRKHRPRGQDPRSIELGAIYNSRCTKCGGQGHLAFECYNTSGQKYELVEEEAPPAPRMGAAPSSRMGGPARMGRGQAHDAAPRMQMGRGRGATLPAWMTQGGGGGGGGAAAGGGANGVHGRARSQSAGRYSNASVDGRDSRRRRRSRDRSRSRSKGRRRDRSDSRGRDRRRDRSRSRSRDRRRETSAERRERKEAKKRRKEEKKRRKQEKKEKKAKKEKKHKKEKERKHESRSDRRRTSPSRSVSRGRSVSSRSSRSSSSRSRSRSP